ncbi:MAG: ABC transporter substrate-binding protein [SAR324 cluster bacterium]
MKRTHWAVPAAALLASLAAAGAAGAQSVKVGEINSYSAQPAFTLPYRNGWQLYVDELNAAGGVLGRKLEVLSRDDGGKPADAVTFANELVTQNHVALLAGTYLSNVGLAVSDFAKQNKVLFVAAEPLSDALTWAKGNRYTYRLRPSTYMQSAMLAEEAAKLPAKRWALLAPNYEYGQSAVAWFKKLLSARRPDVQFVGEQLPALGNMDAGATVEALESYRPDAIFNATFGPDLIKFVREGTIRELFKGRQVVSLISGEPEYLDPMKDEAPQGWIVTGYPWYGIDTPAHRKFVQAYQAKYHDTPRMGSLVGYITFQTIAAALEKAGSTDTEALLSAMSGLTIETPIGPITFRPSDHQGTMGAFVGRTAMKDGKPVMVDWKYDDGAKYLPSPAEVAKLRPQD